MADITMCKGANCPQKQVCYRHTAPVNEYWQSYFIEVPMKEDKTCDELWIREQ